MRARIAAVLLCLLLALTLAGCVHADRAVTLNSDSTGVYTFSIGLSDQLLALGGSSLSDSMNNFGEQVKRAGGSYSHAEDNGYSVWRYMRPFTSVAQLDTFLAQSPQTSVNSGSANSDALNVTADMGFFSTTYHVTGHMSLAFPQANQQARDLLKDARESFAVTMPNWVSAQHGGVQSGNTVSYVVHLDQSATIDVTGVGLNTPHIALVAGGALLALALVIAGLLLLRRGNRPPAKPALTLAPSSYNLPTQPGTPSGETPTFPATPTPSEYPSAPPPFDGSGR